MEKQARTQAKTQLTNSIKRLANDIAANEDISTTIKESLDKMDSCFFTFSQAHSDYLETLAGEYDQDSEDRYLAEATQRYDDARQEYITYRKEGVKQIATGHIKRMANIAGKCELIVEKTDKLSDLDFAGLQDMIDLYQTLAEETKLTGIPEIDSEIGKCTLNLDQLKLSVKARVRLETAKGTTTNTDTPNSEISTSHTSSAQLVTSSSGRMVSSSPGDMTSPGFLVSSGTSPGVTLTSTTVSNVMQMTSSSGMVMSSGVTSDGTGSQGVVLPGIGTLGFASSAGMTVPISMQMTSSSGMMMSSGAATHVASFGSIASGSRSPGAESFGVTSPTGVTVPISMQMTSSSGMMMSSGVTSQAAPPFYSNNMVSTSASGTVRYFGSIPSTGQSESARTMSGGYGGSMPGGYCGSMPGGYGGSIPGGSPIYEHSYVKKSSIITFSGEHEDWPEFHTVFPAQTATLFRNKLQLALELKRSCKGRAAEMIKHIPIVDGSAYEAIWARLAEEYGDPGKSTQSALNKLFSQKAIIEGDYAALSKMIDTTEGIYTQLRVLGQTEAVHMADIDRVSQLLPLSTRVEWYRRYKSLTEYQRVKPFSAFVSFLVDERSTTARLADSKAVSQSKSAPRTRTAAHGATVEATEKDCILHKNANHITEQCKTFKSLELHERSKQVRKARRCYRCFGAHFIKDCDEKGTKCKGNRDHHVLLCGCGSKGQAKTGTAVATAEKEDTEKSAKASTGTASEGGKAVLPILEVSIAGSRRTATAMTDNGSDSSYCTIRCADRYKLRKLGKASLEVTTVGGERTEYDATIYELPIRVTSSRVETLQVYGIEEITGPVEQLDKNVLEELFPSHDGSALIRSSRQVDLLIGTDAYGLHCRKEIAKAGKNLFIMEGPLGVTVVGHHPRLRETLSLNKNVPLKVHSADCGRTNTRTDRQVATHLAFSKPEDLFILGEELGTAINPKCGACKCSKCPIPGYTLSFREEQELKLIHEGLSYDEKCKCWESKYPYLEDPSTLPENYGQTLATLKKTEKSLLKDAAWSKSYGEQLQDMLDRGVARKLTKEELQSWKGPHYYIPHLAVSNPKSKSTPVRIVFNSSQSCNGTSLNKILAKGPDSFRNNMMGILLRWKEEEVAVVGDIKKMFHSVRMSELDQHMHRFLWRDMDTDREPDVYIMTRVNMGDRPAPAIATEALYKTAEMQKDTHPRASEFILTSTYVDDAIDSVKRETEDDLIEETESMVENGGYHFKEWRVSGREVKEEGQQLKGENGITSVLGTAWNHMEDVFTFVPILNFSKKKRGVRTEPDLKRSEVPERLPDCLTRRMVLQQVMAIYDPMGMLAPFTIIAKQHLRETWKLKLDWDEDMPAYMKKNWCEFFSNMFEMEDLKFPRCLRPDDAEGNPWLVILSDGSDLAYGCAAYASWKCNSGKIKMRLIMAKSRIAPVDKVSTPRMELNGAVIAKRCRVVIEKEMRYKFERVIHLVDSETVLRMVHKTSTRFQVYEGVRIGEIQAAMEGSEWGWIPGLDNTADWLTRGRTPSELGPDSEWFNGPKALNKPFKEWNVKFYSSNESDDLVPGMKAVVTHATNVKESYRLIREYKDISKYDSAVRAIARVITILRKKSFAGGREENLSPELINEAEIILIKEVQKEVDITHNDLKKLNPGTNSDGLKVVGANRLKEFNPLGIYSDPPVFLPKNHPLTKLAMEKAHQNGHRGRDGTLASFRSRFWTPRGPHVAAKAKDSCQYCKRRDPKLLEQVMGSLPEARLRPSTPFNHCMLDYFGPYSVRGEVQKRITGKAYGIIITDLYSRCVHMEAAFGYDTASFLLAFSRFASLRGWPSKVYSDPGSQLTSAKEAINGAARSLGLEHGTEWIVGPADSPWHQGAVEALVKQAKRAIHLAVHNQRLSCPEFLTVLTEAANTINERPIGMLPSVDSELNVLTPNCLLLGRSCAKNPGGWQPWEASLKTRYDLVQSIGNAFWKHWTELYAPSLVTQPKWHKEAQRPLQTGDVVLVADQNVLRGEYRLAVVTDTHESKDGKVRSVSCSYNKYKVGEKTVEYKGAPYLTVKRSVQRLGLVVPVNDTHQAEDKAKGEAQAEADTAEDVADAAEDKETAEDEDPAEVNEELTETHKRTVVNPLMSPEE